MDVLFFILNVFSESSRLSKVKTFFFFHLWFPLHICIYTIHAQGQQINFGMHLHTRHPPLIVWVWHFRWRHKYIPSSHSCTTTLQRYIPFWKQSTVVVHLSTWGLFVALFLRFFVLFCVLQLKSFHNELLTELEKKVELDARYLNVRFPFWCIVM